MTPLTFFSGILFAVSGALFLLGGLAIIGTWMSGPHGDLLTRAAVACLGLILIGVGGSLVWDLFR